VKTNAVVKTIRDVPGVEGVVYIAEGKKVYTANWGENKIGVVDLARGSVIKRLPTEAKPDGIAYAAPFHRAYVSNERAKAVSAIDVTTDTIVKVLRFDSETGVPQYDSVARKVYVTGLGRIYVACASGAISVFQMDDPAHFRKLKEVPVEPKVHSLAVDPRTHRVYAPAEKERGRPASKMFVFEAVTD
jgi:YVTN family beta-propeller protein